MISEYRISRTVTPAASLALVTLDQAKAVLGIDPADTSQDTNLQAQINSVSSAIHRYVDHVLVQQAYRDQFRYIYNYTYPGEALQLRQYPIAVDASGVSIVTVTEDGVAIDAAAIETDPDRGKLYRLDGGDPYCWTGSLIAVDYTAGFDPIPDDVQAAAVDWVSQRWFQMGRDPSLRSETIPDLIAQTFAAEQIMPGEMPGVPNSVALLLAPYRMWHL
jgi:hypothetical protein